MTRKRTVVVVALVALMVAAAAPVMANNKTPTVDSETSNTATTSEITQDTVVSSFQADSDNESTIGINGENGTSPEVEISRNDSDNVFHSNTSLNNESRQAGGTLWNMTPGHDEWADMEVSINENVTVDIKAINASNTSNSTVTTFFINATDDRTVENLDDTDADEDTDDAPVTTESLDDSLTKVTAFDIHTLEFSELDVEDREVAGDDTDVIVVFSNDTVADDASDAVPDGVADKDAMFRMTLVVSGDDGPTQPIRVYHEEAPDDVDDDDTYGVYKDGGIGGEDGIEINLGDEYEDAEEFDVTGTLNAGRIAALQHRVATTDVWQSTVGGVLGLISLDGLLTAGVPTLLIGGVAARRRRTAR